MSQKLAELTDLTLVERTEDSVHFHTVVDPTFTIGPKVHGGSVQMVAVVAAREAYAELAGTEGDADPLEPVAISSDYLGAPEPSGIDVIARMRKRGRTVSVMNVDIVQNGRTMIASSVTLARPDSGTARHSAAHLLHEIPLEPPADGIHIDTSPLGEVVHHGAALDLVLNPTHFPMLSGETGDPVVVGWARPKGVEPTSDFAVLVCDISPPVVMNLGLFGWAPTVQLTTYIRRHPAPGWLRFVASSTEVGPGMFEEDHLVVDSTGAVVAQSRQLALIPARG